MTLFETIIDHIVKKHGLKNYQERERRYVILAAVGSGFFGSLLTNCFEVIVIRQQAESGESVLQIFKQEGASLLTKGLSAKLLLCSLQSILFFVSITEIGKLFDVNLFDDKE